MSNCLVMLTKRYPYGIGEEFIENELPVVAREFDRVILIATSVSGPAVPTRAVPGNVEPHAVDAGRIRRSVPFAALGPALAPPKEAYGPAERAAVAHSPLRRLFFAYFAAKGRAVAKAAAAVLAGAGFSRGDRVVFYSYWLYDTAAAAVGLREACRAGQTRAVSRAHRYDLYPSKNPLGYLPMRPYLLKNLDAVFPCSTDGARLLRQTCPEYAGKVRTAYLGTRDFGAGPQNRGGAFHIVSCCHIAPVKRVDLLARSLARLAGDGLALKWTHFGAGDGLEELKQYAAQNLGFMKCRFAGEVKNRELMDFYARTPVDCFVNTSSSEGLPVSIMEACSFGIPVLATDVGGTSEIVREGKNGFLLKPDFAPGELAQRIRELIRMPQSEKQALRGASRQIWQDNFCSETNYRKFARALLSGF
ncbi:MAG TPA: glycosyl transferase family 1 [Ruminococcaceae bacterium]|jgi:glycosyltransferase involved in cell wall biosynthesis|nr:glycosyl transferase family 1 [Oscillospiraceae bacterium]HBT90708.1 glycosyl transferase family 1 [Oscillospiraceae bacterium]